MTDAVQQVVVAAVVAVAAVYGVRRVWMSLAPARSTPGAGGSCGSECGCGDTAHRVPAPATTSRGKQSP
jgi:hypothetical protein